MTTSDLLFVAGCRRSALGTGTCCHRLQFLLLHAPHVHIKVSKSMCSAAAGSCTSDTSHAGLEEKKEVGSAPFAERVFSLWALSSAAACALLPELCGCVVDAVLRLSFTFILHQPVFVASPAYPFFNKQMNDAKIGDTMHRSTSGVLLNRVQRICKYYTRQAS
jgi:hypothetical protein